MTKQPPQITFDAGRCRVAPFAHQRADVQWLVHRPFAFIASEMRTGKSKIVIDAAQVLFEAGLVDTVVVVAPAPVRDVWYDPDLGELAKHLWADLPARVIEFHARLRLWNHGPGGRRLQAWVTNYEYLRQRTHVEELLAVCGPGTMLVLDESSFVKNWQAQQTKACAELRRACGRVVLLNGTPLFHSPLDLFAQGNLLHESIIGSKHITHFRARYAIQKPVLGPGGRPLDNGHGTAIQTIVGWRDLDDLQRRFAPYTVRRLQAECLDLPPKLDPVTLTAALEPETWKAYRQMRDEMVVWLTEHAVAAPATAAIKVLRLSQITNGFIGGVEEARTGRAEPGLLESLDLGPRPAAACPECGGSGEVLDAPGDVLGGRAYTEPCPACAPPPAGPDPPEPATEISREKLDTLLWLIGRRLEEDPALHLVAWGRFRAEVARAEREVKAAFPRFQTAVIMGGQKKAERLRALALLKPETSPRGPVFVAGIEGTGSFGLDMCAAHTCVTMSSGYSPGRAAQTLDRVYGPGQRFPVAYYDIIATGPAGQRTIDRDILLARRAGHDLAQWTAAHWVKALKEE